jgi:hypothetical protein
VVAQRGVEPLLDEHLFIRGDLVKHRDIPHFVFFRYSASNIAPALLPEPKSKISDKVRIVNMPALRWG